MRRQRTRIKLLLFDAHGTIFMPKNRTWQKLVAHVVYEETGYQLDAGLLNRRTKEIRAKYAAESPHLENTVPWWSEVNRRVLARFGHAISLEMGRCIHLRIVEALDLYTVQPARRKFVERLVRTFSGPGVIRAIATNAPDAAIDLLLSKHELRGAVQRIYGSTTLGGVLKPSREFFEAILRRQNVRPEEVLLVANSLQNDVPATRLGIHVCAILRRDEPFTPNDLRGAAPGTLVHLTHSLANAWRWIDRNFVPTA